MIKVTMSAEQDGSPGGVVTSTKPLRFDFHVEIPERMLEPGDLEFLQAELPVLVPLILKKRAARRRRLLRKLVKSIAGT